MVAGASDGKLWMVCTLRAERNSAVPHPVERGVERCPHAVHRGRVGPREKAASFMWTEWGLLGFAGVDGAVELV